jgi:putative YhdH/YhfP family quinone oxidoreductase
MKYSAFVVEEASDSKFKGSVKTLDTGDLPHGEVLIKVSYSSVNYKDALSASGNKGVTRNFPHTPGIDAAGIVCESSDAKFIKGQEVLVIGYDLGMNTSGAFGEYIRVPFNWVVALPQGLTSKQAMAWGTAGFTSALCVEKLITAGITKEQGSVIISGATGGVGSVAIKLLLKLGFDVHAITSKADSEPYLKSLGVSEVVLLSDFLDESKKPMLKPLYAAGIDVAGGNVLSSMLKKIGYQGAIACCGLVDSPTLSTTVLPFILRGVTLAGVDSVELPLDKKAALWNKISSEWSLGDIENNTTEIDLTGLPKALDSVLKGQAQGRYLLKHK